MKKRHRRSFGVFSSATPVIATPSSKRKLPLESGHSFGFSNKKRRSVKKNLGIELLPNTLFSSTSTPGSAYSASGVLESSQNILSPAGRSRRQSATSVRRKSRRLSSRHAVSRVESGKAGCFSPKASKKEAPRKSLRCALAWGRAAKTLDLSPLAGDSPLRRAPPVFVSPKRQSSVRRVCLEKLNPKAPTTSVSLKTTC
ncbi:Rho GTPase-activating protein 11A Rho-type GTPase-activating protein 11A [Larimichthys crocea]|uniref:Rho GTPase-activating protein 11A Rho-type GTPase-activating protein 11A n=1 Tax=Larimichthys crocea TaxID=215358 RepID=A0A6G0IF25_LARCR|nr:Rho GTPase-activating protein 11A Rho-type GTPase-activating protein 11A [Larimichthys crocea]